MSTKWHKGPPPSVGWWPASNGRIPGFYRWWNGRKWSRPAFDYMTPAVAEREARKCDIGRVPIEWSRRPASWPERSRT